MKRTVLVGVVGVGQQLVFAAILAGFSAGVVTAWFVSRRQIETYRKEAAAVLNARDDILEYVNVLSQLVPEAEAHGLGKADVVSLREVVDSIKDQVRDLQKKVDRMKVGETAHWRELERPGELDDTSSRNGRELTSSTPSDAESKWLAADFQNVAERSRPANANVNDPAPVKGFLQQVVDLLPDDGKPKFIGSFPIEPLSVRRAKSQPSPGPPVVLAELGNA